MVGHPAEFIAKKWKDAALKAGLKKPNLMCHNAVAVALAESGGNCKAQDHNSDSVDRGLWQINSKWHSEVSDSCAYECICNAEQAVRISNKGTDWTPWSIGTTGLTSNILTQQRALVNHMIQALTVASMEYTGLMTLMQRLPTLANVATAPAAVALVMAVVDVEVTLVTAALGTPRSLGLHASVQNLCLTRFAKATSLVVKAVVVVDCNQAIALRAPTLMPIVMDTIFVSRSSFTIS